MFVFESQLVQMPGPRDIILYWPSPRAFSVVQKPRGWAHISVQKPRGAGGGMVTGQIDTYIIAKSSLLQGDHFNFICSAALNKLHQWKLRMNTSKRGASRFSMLHHPGKQSTKSAKFAFTHAQYHFGQSFLSYYLNTVQLTVICNGSLNSFSKVLVIDAINFGS